MKRTAISRPGRAPRTVPGSLAAAESFMHSQYGMRYAVSPYARERLKTPFTRIENTER